MTIASKYTHQWHSILSYTIPQLVAINSQILNLFACIAIIFEIYSFLQGFVP